LSACAGSDPGTTTGAAGTSGAAGSGSGQAGTSGQAGSGSGQAGSGSGQAGSGSGQAGMGAAGTGNAAAGTSGGAGMGAAGTGSAAGMGAAGTGSAAGMGAAGAGSAAGTGGGVAKSLGCGQSPPGVDSTTGFKKHDIMVAGVDQAFIDKYPVNGGSQYNWTKRNYYVKLPAGYSPDKVYAVDAAGTGCGGNETSGSNGDYTLPPGTQMEAIQVGLSYVTSSAANPSCLAFTDDYVNTPEVQYLDAVATQVAKDYCIDKNKVFINGYSSGAWEAVLGGCTNADKYRAIGVQIGGGKRMKSPACMQKPAAAFFVVGLLDDGNPIGPLATPKNDSLGVVLARDEMLKRNGCVTPEFQIVDTCTTGAGVSPCAAGIQPGDTYSNVPHAMWDAAYPKCHVYTGCPAKYPVVWCPILVNHGNGPNPMGSDSTVVENYRRQGMWKFFMSLPPP
jgi:hypothetical protein